MVSEHHRRAAAASSARRRLRSWEQRRWRCVLVFLEPDHRAAHAVVAARVIVEDEFLDWTWLELAIRRQPHCRHGKALRLARRVQTEGVGFGFDAADDGVIEWSKREPDDRKNGDNQRQRGGGGSIAQAQCGAPARECAV